MRAIWSGSLSFGLINIPVKLYSASKDRPFKFRLLEKKDLHPIAYLRVKRGTEEVVPYENIVRGYEYEKNRYAVMTDEELKKISPRKTSTIDIINFSDLKEINPKYYEKPYYLEPDKKSEKAYALLAAAMKKAGKAAIARMVIKDKEHIAAIFPEGNTLMLDQLRFENEINAPKGLEIPETTSERHSKEEIEVALALIKTLDKPFNPKQYEDTFSEKLEKAIQSKTRGRTIQIDEEDKAPAETDMKDLMTLLKKSIERAKR